VQLRLSATVREGSRAGLDYRATFMRFVPRRFEWQIAGPIDCNVGFEQYISLQWHCFWR